MQTFDEGTVTFEELLDAYAYERPQRGEIYDGEVIDTSEKDVLLDLGVKRDAFVPQRDIEDLDLHRRGKIKIGNIIPVFITQVYSRTGKLVGSIKKGFEQADWRMAKEHLDSGEISTVQVIRRNSGGLVARFGALQGFIPRSHLVTGKDFFYGDGSEEPTPPTLNVKVIEVNRGKRRLVLSEKQAFKEQLDEHLKDFYEGQVIQARVKRVLKFGAFFDLNGVEGFLHISEIDWGWVEDPADVLSEGDEIEVYVKDVDHERKQVRLSRKELIPAL